MERQIHTKKTLNKYRKDELIDYCAMLEKNIDSLKKTFERQYRNCIKIVEDMNLLNETYKKIKK